MLSLDYVRNHSDLVRSGIRAKGHDPKILDSVLELDRQRRQVLVDLESLRHKVKSLSKTIGSCKKDEREELIKMSKAISARISPLETQLGTIDNDLRKAMLNIPNIPHHSVPAGDSASDNKELERGGRMVTFEFDPLDHVSLGTRLGLIDFDRAAAVSGTGFWVFCGAGARLQRALINLMLDTHTANANYKEIYTPSLIRTESLVGTGQLPKFAEDQYKIQGEDLWLTPTAEVPITNLHRDEIIIGEDLPIYYAGYTPCFRKEAGAAGQDTKGLLRVHQFDKVELVKIVKPQDSYDELESLLRSVLEVVSILELPYRVIELCSGELSFSNSKCYDLEVWAPGTNAWLEVSSVSNFESYQARRAQIRFRNDAGKVEYAHTLNGSGTALPRIVVSILENYQNSDGSVTVPKALQESMGTDILTIE